MFTVDSSEPICTYQIRASTKLKTIKFVVLYLTDPEIQNTTHLARSGVLSSLALCSSPLVQANIEAIGLVDVALPCWC